MTKATETRCSKKIYKDSYLGIPCSRRAVTVERDVSGKERPFCRIHAPSYIAEKRAQRHEKWHREWEAKREGWEREEAIEKATEDLIAAVGKVPPSLLPREVISAFRKLQEAQA